MSEVGQMRTAAETCLLDGIEANKCNWGWTTSNLLGDDANTKKTSTQDLQGKALVATFTGSEATLVATFGNNAATAIANSTLTWHRNDAGTWTCSTTVEGKFKPTGCAGDGKKEEKKEEKKEGGEA